MAMSLPVENLLPLNVGSIINYLQEYTEAAQWELLVAVDHKEIGTKASETVDPIDRSHPHTHEQYPPESLEHSINRCSLSSTGNRACNFSI